MTDVILTCFACSTASPCQIWANSYFKDPPIVLNIPGQGGGDFRNKIRAWAKTGDVFTAALHELMPGAIAATDFKLGRRGLVTFSAGWAAAEELFQISYEREKLDAVILLDGIHTDKLNFFIEFALKAANMDAFMIMAHSAINPPFISSTITNNTIFSTAEQNNKINCLKPMTEESPPEYITNLILEKSLSIKSVYGTTTWNEDPLNGWKNRGNLNLLSYDGNTAEIHIYIARYIAEKCWRWLGEYWVK